MAYAVAGAVRDFRPSGYPQEEPLVPHGMAVIVNAPAVFRYTAEVSPERHLEAAQWLADHGTKLVGVDCLSVEAFTAQEPRTHLTLLGAGVVIVEGLDLRLVPAGEYVLYCLPLKLAGADGAPARAVLITV